MEKRWPSLRQFFFSVGLFIRFPSLGASIIMALFGAVSVARRLPSANGRLPSAMAVSGPQIAGIILGAVAFHSFAYVLNDLVDLPIDRTEPRRKQFPLVRGLVPPRAALLFVLLQIPLTFAITYWLGGDGQAYAVLAAGFGFMAVYDVWGKRLFLPPLTDVAQGIGWGCLAVWAAALMPGELTRLTGLLFVYLVLFITLINGLHGSLRDLANDFQHGVRSTAVYLGVSPQRNELPPRLKRYAFVLQATLIVVSFIPFFGNMLEYSAGAYLVTGTAVALLNLAAWRLLQRALNLIADRPQMLAIGTLHLLALFGVLVALFTFRLPGWLQMVVLPLFLTPLLTHTWVRNTLKWAWRSGGAGPIAASNFPTPDPEATADVMK